MMNTSFNGYPDYWILGHHCYILQYSHKMLLRSSPPPQPVMSYEHSITSGPVLPATSFFVSMISRRDQTSPPVPVSESFHCKRWFHGWLSHGSHGSKVTSMSSLSSTLVSSSTMASLSDEKTDGCSCEVGPHQLSTTRILLAHIGYPSSCHCVRACTHSVVGLLWHCSSPQRTRYA